MEGSGQGDEADVGFAFWALIAYALVFILVWLMVFRELMARGVVSGTG